MKFDEYDEEDFSKETMYYCGCCQCLLILSLASYLIMTLLYLPWQDTCGNLVLDRTNAFSAEQVCYGNADTLLP